MNEDDFVKAVKIIAKRSGRPKPRVVSLKEYRVLEKMALENKLDMSGYPKEKYFEEYCKLMKEQE